MTEAEKVEYLSSLARSPVWTDILVPQFQEKMNDKLRHLIQGRNRLSDTEIRVSLGEISELEAFLSYPERAVEDFKLTQEEEMLQTEAELRQERRAELVEKYGLTGPYAVTENG